MLAIERKKLILEQLQRDKKVIVADLAKVFDVTEETIRRDLEKLEREGFAQKIYGGAVLKESFNVDLPYAVRKRSNVTDKQYIAGLIADMIQDGDSIMLDASSTALFVAQNIKSKKNITIITNSVEIICEIADRNSWKVISTGGTLKEGALALVGSQTTRTISNYHVDLAVFSCKGISAESGLTDASENDAEIKKAIIASAHRKILAVDHSKFDIVSFVGIADLKEIDLVVTDRKPDGDWDKVFEKERVELIY
ncbi:MAG: DeoR/GlpR transcriptional regulator [Ruminococcaceae bacterium]|nr:DeoR/GlpR transcriptional regulator [Oscillospiraceae bacterium]